MMQVSENRVGFVGDDSTLYEARYTIDDYSLVLASMGCVDVTERAVLSVVEGKVVAAQISAH